MEQILKILNIDQRLIDIAMGRIRIFSEFSSYQYAGIDVVKGEMPHPPFLIPLTIQYSADHYYDGIIKHWFVNREMTYGSMTGTRQFETFEIARSAEQYFLPIIFQEIENSDGNLDDYILKSAQQLGIHNLKEIQSFVLNDDFKSFDKSIFKDEDNIDSPSYKGDFPSYLLVPPRNLSLACYCEISRKEWIGYVKKNHWYNLFKKKSKFRPIEHIPEWLRPETDKKELFELYLKKKELDKAWLVINGPGFKPLEVGERLQLLKQHTKEEGFHLWADFWCDKYGHLDDFFFM